LIISDLQTTKELIMRKLLLYFFALATPLVSVSSAEPDTSDITSLQDVFEVLDSQPVTYLDLKLERASRVLTTQRCYTIEVSEFDNLNDIRKGNFEITTDGTLICHINFSGEDMPLILQRKIKTIQQVYDSTLKLAKKYIHHSVNDNNFVVVMTSTTFYWKNGERDYYDNEGRGYRNDLLDIEEKSIVKFENGRPTYYNQFFVGLIDL